MLKGIEHFQEAIAKDPGYAVAYAGLADAYELLSIGFGSKPPVEYLAQAKTMALEGPGDGRHPRRGAHVAGLRPLAGDLDWSGAEKEFKRALELKSSYVMAHEWYAEYLAALGPARRGARGDQAGPAARPALGAGEPRGRMGGLFRRRYDQAIEELRKTLGMDPRFPRRPPGALVGARQGGARGGDRRYPEGGRAPGIAHHEEADAGIRLRLGGATGRSRRDPLGARVQAGGREPAGLAVGAAVHGDGREGPRVRAAGAGVPDPGARPPVPQVAPWADPLRSDPRYAALVERLGLG